MHPMQISERGYVRFCRKNAVDPIGARCKKMQTEHR